MPNYGTSGELAHKDKLELAALTQSLRGQYGIDKSEYQDEVSDEDEYDLLDENDEQEQEFELVEEGYEDVADGEDMAEDEGAILNVPLVIMDEYVSQLAQMPSKIKHMGEDEYAEFTSVPYSNNDNLSMCLQKTVNISIDLLHKGKDYLTTAPAKVLKYMPLIKCTISSAKDVCIVGAEGFGVGSVVAYNALTCVPVVVPINVKDALAVVAGTVGAINFALPVAADELVKLDNLYKTIAAQDCRLTYVVNKSKGAVELLISGQNNTSSELFAFDVDDDMVTMLEGIGEVLKSPDLLSVVES